MDWLSEVIYHDLSGISFRVSPLIFKPSVFHPQVSLGVSSLGSFLLLLSMTRMTYFLSCPGDECKFLMFHIQPTSLLWGHYIVTCFLIEHFTLWIHFFLNLYIFLDVPNYLPRTQEFSWSYEKFGACLHLNKQMCGWQNEQILPRSISNCSRSCLRNAEWIYHLFPELWGDRVI